MKISIISVCLNSAKTLSESLQSVRMQSYKNFELIIVDGQSVDETLQIVADFADIVTTIVSERDKGIYDAMNKGVALATGDVVFFLNSDDVFYDSNVLFDVVDYFSKNPSVDLLFGNVIFERDLKLTKRTYSHINRCTLPFESLCHQSVFARRALFNKVGSFNLNFKTNADYDWLIKVFNSDANCRWFNRTISIFHVGGMHGQNPELLANEHKLVRLQHMSNIKLFLGDVVRRVVHRFYRHCKAYPLGEAELDTPQSKNR